MLELSLCKQCNTMHPRLPEGEKCPNAIIQHNGTTINFEKLFVPLKNICTANIQKKNIKNIDKLFSFTIIKLTKILEGYNEE